jgi:MarR family 2-MHQ and catechol resistance regulon transcriptional repressor
MPTRFDGTVEQRRALDAFITLNRAANAVAGRTSVSLREAGLTVSQFGVLEALHHLGPLCLKDLAAKILKSSGNLTTVVDNLEGRDLVERRRSALDRRVITVHLTPTGRRLVRKVLPEHVDEIVRVFASLSDAEQEELRQLCRTLGRSLDGERPR